MAGSLDIFPFHDTEGAVRFGIQIAIFLVGVVVAQKLIIAPAIRLHNERNKRTVGRNEDAQLQEAKAQELENEYILQLKKGGSLARELRQNEIKIAQKQAQKIIADSSRKANLHLNEIKEKLSLEMMDAKSHLPNHINDIVSVIYKKIGLILLFALLPLISFVPSIAFADAGAANDSAWYTIFWPYFQFVCFVAALVYFAKKPITAMLEKRRDDFKAKLSEAKEAAVLAERKIKNYEKKIASLQAEIEELKRSNLAEAQVECEKILAEAAKTSETILREAERSAKELITRSREEIRKEMIQLALDEVEKRLTSKNLAQLDAKFKQETIQGIQSLS